MSVRHRTFDSALSYSVYSIAPREKKRRVQWCSRNLVYVKSVLIVDDSPLIRGLLKAALTEAGWMVCAEAANGREGIVKAQELNPDIIVLDLSMPEMNGFETALVLKRIMPATPLLMFTSHFVPGLKKEASLAGFQDVVSKSDGPGAVISAINRLLVV